MHPTELARLASAPVPVLDTVMQLTIFGWRAADGTELEEVVALRTPSRPGAAAEPPLVRLHSACFTGDVLGSAKCDCGPQLGAALAEIVRASDGVLLYLLRHEGRGIGLANKIRAYALQAAGHDTISANLALGLPAEARDFAAAAVCLKQLGLHRIRLMTNNPLKVAAMVEHGIEVAARVPLCGFLTPHNRHYLETKDRSMGHLGAGGPAADARAGQPA
jgi:GTP cyclohydrolase II